MGKYRAPSMKTLQSLHWLDDSKRKEIRSLLHKKVKTTDYLSVQKWVNSCHNMPSWHEKVMCALDEILETFGVEPLWHNGKLNAVYCNTGDTYNTTIVYRYDTDSFSVTSWGNLVEKYNWNGKQF